MDWSREEVEATVADYLHMLVLELTGQSYSKTAHRQRLLQLLNSRSDASIEFKHCNVSAVLLSIGYPSIRGYKPRSNYQELLGQVVAEQVSGNTELHQAAQAAATLPATVPFTEGFHAFQTMPPARHINAVAERMPSYALRAVKRDYLSREAANMALGLAGEKLVVQFEHWRLVQSGNVKLADRVEHISQTKGDGLGFDVLSFDSNGRERFIEVKTTAFGKETPFFVSRGELALSQTAEEQFHLYRLFEFRKGPRLFDLLGKLDDHCTLDPVTYRASFG